MDDNEGIDIHVSRVDVRLTSTTGLRDDNAVKDAKYMTHKRLNNYSLSIRRCLTQKSNTYIRNTDCQSTN